MNKLEDFTATYSCRFHPTDGWHEVGCPHVKQWSKEELQEALNLAKQSNNYLIYLLSNGGKEDKVPTGNWEQYKILMMGTLVRLIREFSLEEQVSMLKQIITDLKKENKKQIKESK